VIRRVLAGVGAAAAVVVLAVTWAAISTALQGFFGFQNNGGNGSHYLFWSGAGSDLAYLSFLGAGIAVYRKHNCAYHLCWRIGRHEFTDPQDNVKRLLCWKHHPDVRHKTLRPDVLRDIQQRRHLYLGKNPGRG
jgi:hypothetical protein